MTRKSTLIALSLAATTTLVLGGCGSDSISKAGSVKTPPPAASTDPVQDYQPTDTPSFNAPLETDTPSPTENLYGLTVGDAITVTSSDGSEVDITVYGITITAAPIDDFTGPPTNGEYVIADVGYSCTSGPCYYNELDWSAADPAGRTYDDALGSKDPRLGSGSNLGTARNVRGLVTLDAAIGVTEVDYASSGGSNASWKIPVGS